MTAAPERTVSLAESLSASSASARRPADGAEQSLRFAAQDGRVLGGRLYLPDSGPTAAVVLAGAYAVPQRHYARFARWLAGRGRMVLTFDYRGVGESRDRPPARDPARLQDWGRLDLDAAVGLLRARSSGLPLAAVCHSFGGQALGLSSEARRLRAAVTLGSGFGAARHFEGRDRMRIEAFSGLLMPTLVGLWGYLPGWAGLGQDVPAEVAREWATWLRSDEYLLDHLPEARRRFAALRAPAWLLTASDDDYCPEPALRHLAAHLPAGRAEVLDPADLGLSGLGHFGYFRPAAEPLWRRLDAFLEEAMNLEPQRAAG